MRSIAWVGLVVVALGCGKDAPSRRPLNDKERAELAAKLQAIAEYNAGLEAKRKAGFAAALAGPPEALPATARTTCTFRTPRDCR